MAANAEYHQPRRCQQKSRPSLGCAVALSQFYLSPSYRPWWHCHCGLAPLGRACSLYAGLSRRARGADQSLPDGERSLAHLCLHARRIPPCRLGCHGTVQVRRTFRTSQLPGRSACASECCGLNTFSRAFKYTWPASSHTRLVARQPHVLHQGILCEPLVLSDVLSNVRPEPEADSLCSHRKNWWKHDRVHHTASGRHGLLGQPGS